MTDSTSLHVPRLSHWRRRLLVAVCGSVVGLGVVGAGIAFGYFLTSDSSSPAQAVAGSIGAGQQPSASVSGRDVSLTWGSASHAATYAIARTNTVPGSLGGSLGGTCSSSVSGTSCTDSGVPENGTSSTTWSYTDTPTLFSWQGTISTARSVTIPGPSLSLVSSAFTADGGATTASVASFFDGEGVTFCVDASVSCPAGQTVGSTTIPASGGAASGVAITIPAGMSVGNHTVYAIGSAGSLPSTSITVSPGTATKVVFTTAPPASTATNVTFATTVAEEDAHGNVETADSSSAVALAVNSGPAGGNLSCTTTPTTLSSGQATFSGCSLSLGSATPYTLKATVGAFSVVSGNIAVSQPPAITSAASTTFTVGTNGSFQVTASGYPASTFSDTAFTGCTPATLPSGVTLSSGGLLSGTPAANTGGTYTVCVVATNGVSPNATQKFTLTVDQAPSITSGNGATFTTGSAGTFTVTTTGFPTDTITDTNFTGCTQQTLPSGVTFTDNGNNTATLSGTPAAGTGGTYTVCVTASNGVGSAATQTFTLTVDQPAAITSANSTSFTFGTAGSFTVTTSGFPTATSITNLGFGGCVPTSLPAGVSFTNNSNGTATIASTTTGPAGSYTFCLNASNGVGATATQTFTLTINKASQTISWTPPTTGTAGNSTTLSATGGGSGNPVVFTVDASSGSGVCSVSGTNGTTLNYLAAGSCVVDANQAGNTNYLAATQVQATITVSASVSVSVLAQSTSGTTTSIVVPTGRTALVLAYVEGSSGTPSGSVSTGSGTPFQSQSLLLRQSISSSGSTKDILVVVQAVGNGSPGGPVTFTSNSTVKFLDVVLLSSGSSVQASKGNPSSDTSSTTALATLTSPTNTELVFVGLNGNSGADTITAPSGFGLLGTYQSGSFGGDVGMYFSSTAQASASFTLSPTSVDWGTIALQIG